MSLASGDPRHGTANGYKNLGCRCDRCREAQLATWKEWAYRTGRHRPAVVVNAERRAAAEARDNHGTETRYITLGCRCAACRAAATEAKRRRRERSRVPCLNCGTPVNSINRDRPDKPLECWSCAMKRVNAERQAAA